MKDQISSTICNNSSADSRVRVKKAGDQRNADSANRCALRLFHPGWSFQMLSDAASGKCSGWGILRACLWCFHGVLYFFHTESHGNRKLACLSGKHGRRVSWCLSVSKDQEAFARLSWRSGWNRADRRAALLSGSHLPYGKRGSCLLLCSSISYEHSGRDLIGCNFTGNAAPPWSFFPILSGSSMNRGKQI